MQTDNITLARPYCKTDLYGARRLPWERLEPQRDAIDDMIDALLKVKTRLERASDKLSEENLQCIAEAVEMTARAVRNLDGLGWSGFEPYEYKAIEWR